MVSLGATPRPVKGILGYDVGCPMKIAVVTVAYSSTACIDSLAQPGAIGPGVRLECHLFRHSAQPAIVEACARFAANAGTVSYPCEGNRGVSRSWNDGILAAWQRGADAVIVANDDIAFAAGDLEKLAACAIAHRDRYIISCAGFHAGHNRRLPSIGYSCFAINPVAIERLGCFDENIFPAYCEDQDYARRAGLAGLHEENCAATELTHLGSASIRSDPALHRQNSLTHLRNIAYYRQKWGGDGGRETYAWPFNNPRLGIYINPRNRGRPYGPAYDRRDHDIVKL